MDEQRDRDIDRKCRTDAYTNLVKLGLYVGGSYHSLAQLVGRTDDYSLVNLSARERRLLQLLAGPHAVSILKLLELRGSKQGDLK